MPDAWTSALSDEPTRVDRMVSGLLGDQRGWTARLENGYQVELAVGANGKDDCAIFSLDGSADLVIGSDYVRGSKFMLYELGYLDNYDIGYYLAAANLSDIAAMGALPIGLVSVIRYPSDLPDSEFAQIISGIRDACAAVGIHDVGGDIGTAERIILSATATGIVEPGRALLRSGAKAGDALYVSGTTGLAAAAMVYFAGKKDKGWGLAADDETVLLDAWRRVDPHVRLGRELVKGAVATSCQDTSDGLRATIEQISAASGVGFEVDLAAVPIHPVVARVAALTGADELALVFGASVDFRLLFTARVDADPDLSEFADVFRIGVAVEGGTCALRRPDGELTALPGIPWRHQADPLAGFSRHG